jgi:hypothetical protein
LTALIPLPELRSSVNARCVSPHGGTPGRPSRTNFFWSMA